MSKTQGNTQWKQRLIMLVVAVLCGIMAFFEFFPLDILSDEQRNDWLLKILQQTCGSTAVIILLYSMRVNLYGKPEKWLYLLPCVLIAVNNFQWWSFFAGKMTITRTHFWDITLFTLQCILVGLFEELIFRGAVFSLLASIFSKDKKGLWLTYVVSSIIFAFAHIFNGNALQVGYTMLTGGLFAFVLIKTKNVFCCAFVHALYNWFGLLMDQLGTGVVFDVGTCVVMAVIAVLGGIFVVYSVYTYPEEERKNLYIRLGVKEQKESLEVEENQEI